MTSGPVRIRRVLVIEPMTSAVEILGLAADLGWRTAAATWDVGDRRMPAEVRSRVDTLIRVDPNDERALTEAVLLAHAAEPFDAVLPGIEFYVATAARLADRLGLPGLPAATADALRDKALMRDSVAAAGLPMPRHATAADEASLLAAAAAVGFPAVLKPRDSAGSIHVTRVDDERSLLTAYRALLADHRPDDVGRPIGNRVVLEEYVPGSEVSADGYIGPDGPVVLSVTEKVLSAEPKFVELGHLVGGSLDEDTRQRIDDYVARVCAALRINTGPFHCELRLPAGEPMLIEVGARLPGGRISTLIEWVTGVSLPRIALAAAAGLPLPEPATRSTPAVPVAGVHNFTAPQLTRLRTVSNLDRLQRLDWIREVRMDIGPGDPVPPFGDFRCRLGYVLFIADSPAQARTRRAEIEATVRLG